MSSLLQFTDDSFETEVLKSELPVLVDFGAVWCVPCKKQEPIVEELAGSYADRMKFGQLDVGENTAVAAKYGIMSVPTILIFQNGEIREHLNGLVSKKKLVDTIEKHI